MRCGAGDVGVEVCLFNPRTGCMGWELQQVCQTNQVCTQGQCIDLNNTNTDTNNDAPALLDEEAPPGNTEEGCTTATPSQAQPTPWLTLLLALGLVLSTQRRTR